MTYLTKECSIEFEGNKILYHYTSIYTAIEYIFPFSRLRLAPIVSASDPMEQEFPRQSVSKYGFDEDMERLNIIDGYGIARKVKNYYKSLHQLCLCRNANVDFEGHFAGAFEPIDHFGFAKPRMWDQYGDKFRGVCIALSRDKLSKLLSPKFKIIDVNYCKNYQFRLNMDKSVDLNKVEQIGEEEYLKLMYESELEKIKCKHNDYSDENECKIVVESEDDNVFIDIRECIQGIFITNKLNFIYRPMLKNIAARFKVPLIEILISRTGLEVRPVSN